MPLVAYKDLPTFERLKKEGRTILPADRALSQEIREMHIGFLNMMQDGALIPTERQFFRLIGESNRIAQFYVHPFVLPELNNNEEAQAYTDQYYEPFEKIQDEGLDALIITGRNVPNPDLKDADFWEPLQKVLDWSWNNVTSTLTACLATHAVMQMKYDQHRTALPEKHIGVFKSRVRQREHPIVKGMNTVFDVPHGRNNQITWEQFEKAGMQILVNSHEGGVHMATSPDGFRLVCMQGHQEYDTISLLKEYRRDLLLHYNGELEQEPEMPKHYFSSEALEILEKYKADFTATGVLKDFPEEQIAKHIENTWRDSAKAIIGNWIGLVYQLTNVDRQKQFMDGVDPNDPLKSL